MLHEKSIILQINVVYWKEDKTSLNEKISLDSYIKDRFFSFVMLYIQNIVDIQKDKYHKIVSKNFCDF